MSNELSAAYWAGAARGTLVVQRCETCGRLRHYPRVLCDNCYSFDVAPVEVEPEGELFGWTVSHHAFGAEFADEVPYTVATVAMSCGIRVLGRLRDADDLRLGLPVHLTFETGHDGAPIPVFRPTNSDTV